MSWCSSRKGANGQVHFVATSVNEKSFLPIYRMPRQGAVGKPASSWFLDNVYNFHWFHNSEAQQPRSYDDMLTRRYRPERVHDKTTLGFYLPLEHFVSGTVPNRVAAPDEARHF